MILFVLILFSIFFIILTPVSAWAWGPATHLEITHTILSSPGLVTGPVRELIMRFPHDFLYGSVSADIVMGKNLMQELTHCHNWRVGLGVFKKARKGSEKAFACGYLSHLAADTVAHNHFIPEMMIRSFPTRSLRHLYWELRFDALVADEVWGLHKTLSRGSKKDNHRLLDSVFVGTPLSFTTNKTIFTGFLLLNRIRRWQEVLRLVDRSSRWRLPEEAREKFMEASLTAAVDVLSDQDDAPCLSEDPTGRRALKRARMTRKRLKKTRLNKDEYQGSVEEALKEIRV
ncbi:MAG: zinc dependent phospholipase C family protein [Thermodesulfobacteriota bacterium]